MGETRTDSESQITARREIDDTAFEDVRSAHCNLSAEAVYSELVNEPDQVGRMIEAFRRFIGNNQMMAYHAPDGRPPKGTSPSPKTDRLALSPLRPGRESLFEDFCCREWENGLI